MPWEQRGRGRYYYRRTAKGRLYLGRGPQAELAASQEARQRAERLAQKDAEQQERDQLQQAETKLVGFASLANLLMAARMYAAGYHPHGLHWRERRDVGTELFDLA